MSTFKPYLNQNFDSLKSQCLRSGKLFEDDLFPANNSSIFKFKNIVQTPNLVVSWKRPYEIFKNPEFVVDYIEPNDLDQGQLGDCWFIASAAAVLTVPEYANRIIPSNQSFEKKNYAGIFHFRFWHTGEWVDIVVDDRLPVDQNNNIIFCHNSVDKNEMFGPLLEKAYAKLNICYEFLIGGIPTDALVDFTGGVRESFNLKRSKPNGDRIQFVEPNILWELILKSFALKSLSSCAAQVKKGQSMEAKQPNGLVVGHAYTLMNAYEIVFKGGQFSAIRNLNDPPVGPSVRSIKLLKIRNPWGQQTSYKGSWSAGTKEWNQISDSLKQILKPNDQTDGQFYMLFQDFTLFFDNLDIVHINLNALYDETGEDTGLSNWQSVQFNGEWIVGKNAGGCGNNDQKAYWTNPQYKITIPSVTNQKTTSVFVSLLQTESAKKRAETNGSFENAFEALGFCLYSIKPDAKFQNDKYDPIGLIEIGRCDYVYTREVTKRFELKPGNYVIITSLFDKNKATKFLLRVFYETNETKSFNENTNKNSLNNVKPQPKLPSEPTPAPIISNNKQDFNKPDNKTETIVNNINNNPKTQPSEPTPLPNSKELMKNEDYDKWFYGGMTKKDIDLYNRQAELTTSKACSIM